MLRFNRDLKFMPRSTKGLTYILVITDEVTDHLTCMLVQYGRSQVMSEILINSILTKCDCPDVMIMDQESAFISSRMSLLRSIEFESRLLAL